MSPKRDQKGFRGPRDNFEDEPKNLVRFWRASPTKRRNVRRGRFLILMRFIDPRIFDFNDIHRPHPGPQENMQSGGVRCAISQIWPKFREMLGENPADIQL